MLSGDIAQGRQQQLEGREPLLPVDHLEGLDLRAEGLHLVDHDRAHEMGDKAGAVAFDPRDRALDILPQQAELRIVAPGILPLIERDQIAALAVKQANDRASVRLHAGVIRSGRFEGVVKYGFEQARADLFASREAGFELVAQGHQLIDLGHDSLLLGKWRERDGHRFDQTYV